MGSVWPAGRGHRLSDDPLAAVIPSPYGLVLVFQRTPAGLIVSLIISLAGLLGFWHPHLFHPQGRDRVYDARLAVHLVVDADRIAGAGCRDDLLCCAGRKMKALRSPGKTCWKPGEEPKVYGLLLFFPALFVVVYYIAFGQTGKGLAQMLTISVVNQDAGPAGDSWSRRCAVRRLTDSPCWM